MTRRDPGEKFFADVYDELRRLAASKLKFEAVGHSLDATALVHEAYLRLGSAAFGTRSDFLRAAAVAMQRILVDHARAKRAAKRGGSSRRLALAEENRWIIPDPDALLDVAEAVDRLAAVDPGAADIARCHLFAGLSVEDAASTLGLSRAVAYREWAFARAWLADALATARTNS